MCGTLFSLEFNCIVTLLYCTETLLQCVFFTAIAVGHDMFYRLDFGIFLLTVGSNCLKQYICLICFILSNHLFMMALSLTVTL